MMAWLLFIRGRGSGDVRGDIPFEAEEEEEQEGRSSKFSASASSAILLSSAASLSCLT